ncbi:hypothetical protein SAMN04487949_1018 [Halogranum gelatinilyticum]|uniref:Uncharacterized protein n=1 Tax=Halogranum gelatinilyticum TaxID=660521 RepID=A0A1G9QVM9_9EURY|nr:hypothetical protein [Halogranum gelatinilyticum]SDM14315.1 hypothetical protein SAMN04487949_1018 [Halogranum gelatinilyticum]
MIGHGPLQLATFLEVLPAWLPVVTISLGICLLLTGMSNQYLSSYIGHWPAYNGLVGVVLTGSITGSVAGATYLTIVRSDLLLLFVFFTFVSGQLIQGAVAARVIEKIVTVLSEISKAVSGEAGGPGQHGSATVRHYLTLGVEYLVGKMKDRLLIFLVTGVISAYTTLTIVAVFVVGDGHVLEAIERFWTGFLLLTIAGVAFDFRYFAHRVSYTAALGLVIAASGAFLYSPVGFSNLTGALAPYLENPIPDWMRLPLGAFGFFAGVVLWSFFYMKLNR